MPLLSQHWHRVREVLVTWPLGLLTDLDGTLSEIAPTPEAAVVSPRCRRLLQALVPRLSLVAVISGRPAAQARAQVGVEGVLYLGNHGLERWEEGGSSLLPGVLPYLPRLKALLGELKQCLSLPGLRWEDKGATLAVHYRGAADPEGARHAILEAIARCPNAQEFSLSEGKRVIELRPPLSYDKGVALSALLEEYRLQGLFYLGDDATDLDAFRALKRARQQGRCKGLAIGVLGAETPPEVLDEADLMLEGVGEVERFLSALVESLPRPG